MTDALSVPPGAAENGEPRWRVILIGRGLIESRLRREPTIELVRCRSAELSPGALAEARRDAAAGVGPARTLVLLCPGAVEHGEEAGLLRALAMVDASVRCVVAGGEKVRGAAWIPESSGAEALFEAVDGAPTSAAREARAPAPEQGPAPGPSGPDRADPADPAHDGRAEQRLLRALLAGSDLVGPALERLRAAVGASRVDVRPVSGDGSEPALGAGDVAVAAEHRGRVFAWLVGPRSLEAALRSEAHLLALWMAVGEQHAQLRAAAFTDPLTGAWNRRYLERFLDMALDRARRDRRGVTLLLFDIDNFKHYNDTYGHPAGDEILRETVRLLTSVIRPTDRVCRIGGDEFAVVFDDPAGPRRTDSQPPSSIHEITRRFQKQITEHRFPKLGEQARAPLTISGGMATFPWDASDAASLLERADRLILDSKTRGKNLICLGPGAQRALGCADG